MVQVTRAKFRVQSVTRFLSSIYNKETSKFEVEEVQTVKFQVVTYTDTDKNSENAKFFASTPSGIIELALVNKEIADSFELNKDYYVDFSRAKE